MAERLLQVQMRALTELMMRVEGQQMILKTFEFDKRQKRLIEETNIRAETAALGGRQAPDGLVERMTQEVEGVFAVTPANRDEEPRLRPTVFLDIDDVLALNKLYGGRHVQRAATKPDHAPNDLYQKVFSRDAVEALNELIREFDPRVVLTTSWLMLLERQHFIDLFQKTGVQISETSLHSKWDAQQDFGTSRLDAIERWLTHNHQGEPIVVLDDCASGEGLVGSLLHEAGRVVLCEVDVGFNSSLMEAARSALQKPFNHVKPWEK